MIVKVLDILYNNELCSLVYIQDLTQFVKDNERQKVEDSLQVATTCVSEGLQVPQQTIIMLTN